MQNVRFQFKEKTARKHQSKFKKETKQKLNPKTKSLIVCGLCVVENVLLG